MIVNNSKENTKHLKITKNNIINGYIRDCKMEIELPSIKELKAWINSDFVYDRYRQPYLLEFDNRMSGKKDYIGFNASYLIDFITITKAKKVYLCKGSNGVETTISPIYYKDNNVEMLLLPMRVEQDYIKLFKKSLKNL